jgi:hypothetical protein
MFSGRERKEDPECRVSFPDAPFLFINFDLDNETNTDWCSIDLPMV